MVLDLEQNDLGGRNALTTTSLYNVHVGFSTLGEGSFYPQRGASGQIICFEASGLSALSNDEKTKCYIALQSYKKVFVCRQFRGEKC